MPVQLKSILAALLVACCVGLGWWTNSLRDENKRLGTAVADLTVDLAASQKLRESDQAVAARYAKSVATLTTINKASNAKLQAALRANATWADSPVPPDVAAALGMPSPAPAH